MLTITAKQWKGFADAALRHDLAALRAQCRDRAPELCGLAGDPAVAGLVDVAIAGATSGGFHTLDEVRFYLDLMLDLGWRFHDDARYSWMREYLVPSVAMTAGVRAMLLHRGMEDRLEQSGMLDGTAQLELVDEMLAVPETAFIVGSRDQLKPLYESFRLSPCCGSAAAFDELARAAAATASHHRLPSPQGLCLVLGVMLAFGHGAAGDPMYAWLWAPSCNGTPLDPGARISSLLDKLRQYATVMLDESAEI